MDGTRTRTDRLARQIDQLRRTLGESTVANAQWERTSTIVDRFGMRMLRDPFSSKPYVEFYTTKKTGGGIVMYEAIKALKIAAS